MDELESRVLAQMRSRLDVEFEEVKDTIMAMLKQAYYQGSSDRYVELSTKRSGDDQRTNQ
jgi:hypothetical protein